MITIEGQLEHITFHNPENNYTVAKFRAHKTQALVNIVGYLPGPSPGESLNITGDWETHPRYGSQLKIESYELVLPKTADNIEHYLSSGIIEGIGPKLAARLVSHLGDQTLEIIENAPERLLDVPGIGKNITARIAGSWNTHHTLRNLMHFLQEHRIPTSYSAKILRIYGSAAIATLRDDPYRAAREIPGIGFSMADALAQRLGISKTDPARVHACLYYLLEQNSADGHMYAPESQLLERCKDFLHTGYDQVKSGIDALVDSGELVRDRLSSPSGDKAIFLKDFYLTENGVADRLKAFLSVPMPPSTIDTDQIITEVLRRLAIKPSPEQIKVLQGIFSHRVAIITGGPGTGKTTLIRSIAAILSFLGKDCLLAAPTGRAARRLAEVTRKRASTIHKLLGFNFSDGRFSKGPADPLEADSVIIDEASMLDSRLMYHLLEAVPMTATLILVGDVFQLPSVGPGNVLSDMIQSRAIPTFELHTIYRQAQESPIVMNAHKVRMGETPDLERAIGVNDRSEFNFIEQPNPEKALDAIVNLCCEKIPRDFGFDPIADIQVLSPMHKGAVGTINLNQVLQQALNPSRVAAKYSGTTFKLDDKVMHLKNNYQKDVFNGDIGTICEIDNADRHLTVDYNGWFVEYSYEELNELSLAYTISVLKSQGSEYPAVIIPIMTQHFALLQRNLIYTAMTRGKHLVVFVGTRQAFGIALKNDKPHKRLSSLATRLTAY
jgi:exodeoxyribonuclease V alpha subunit